MAFLTSLSLKLFIMDIFVVELLLTPNPDILRLSGQERSNAM